jgi:hypothetical protein
MRTVTAIDPAARHSITLDSGGGVAADRAVGGAAVMTRCRFGGTATKERQQSDRQIFPAGSRFLPGFAIRGGTLLPNAKGFRHLGVSEVISQNSDRTSVH